MTGDVRFACTQCGNCCRNLKLPLTVTEALRWMSDGNDVQVICEAVPWPAEPPLDDQKAAHRRRRSFAATSGSVPTQVAVVLAGHFIGSCPNLLADRRCAIYERRPLVCRIYPAEINPFIPLAPGNKACPPEAWAANGPLLQRDGRLQGAAGRADVALARQQATLDAPIKARLCAALKITAAALADEGFVVHSPDRAGLLHELRRAIHAGSDVPESSWIFVSNQSATVASIASIGGVASLVGAAQVLPYHFLGFRSAS